MKKVVIILVIIGALFPCLIIVARVTHMYATYTIPTPSNLPTLKVRSWILASSLKKADRGDFIVYDKGNEVWMHRCVAKAGDVIALKNAVLFVNGKKVDEPYVYNEYKISRKDFSKIQGYIEKNANPVTEISNDTVLVSLTDAELKKYDLKLQKNILSGYEYPIFQDFKKKGFEVDNFGPLKVPEGKVFVLGDNRHDSADSRYTGFIDENDIVATVVNI